MTSPTPISDDPSITYPLPLSHLAHRYYLYNIHHITHLRRHFSTPGVLIGSLPQAPQQNVFLGLPLCLLPEEARLLVEQGVCYVVDDAAAHRQRLRAIRDQDGRRYLEALAEQGREVSRAVQRRQEGNTEKALMGMSAEKREMVIRKREEARLRAEEKERAAAVQMSGEQEVGGDDEDDALFPSYDRGTPQRVSPAAPSTPPRSSTPTPSLAPSTTAGAIVEHHIITPTTSSLLLTPPSPPSDPTTLPPVNQHAYAIYSRLHALNYFMSPGLRFGCQYMAYPGDPLRFHSHFLCRGYAWDEEIDLLDLVGGGRLGTGVKKGFLIGGREEGGVGVEGQAGGEEGEDARCFCIEWGGM